MFFSPTHIYQAAKQNLYNYNIIRLFYTLRAVTLEVFVRVCVVPEKVSAKAQFLDLSVS